MKYSVVLLLTMLSFICLAQNDSIPSKVFYWDDISALESVARGPSDGFISLDMSVKTIKPGQSMMISGKEVETLVIMKSGRLSQQVKKNKADLGTGSITVMHAGNKLKAKNNASEDAVFYLMQWQGINPEAYEPRSDYPDVVWVNWDSVTFRKTDKGGRRNIMRQPTPMLNEFEMHVTTLNEGVASHAPHTHLDEEIILVRFGEVEEYIDGDTIDAGEGSYFFLRSMIPHGIRNIGKGQCEYYAFRWIPR